MQQITWKEEYDLGDTLIDAHHKIFFEMVRDIADWGEKSAHEKDSSSLMTFLEGYIHMHFEAEEAFMQRIHYPALEEHQKVHRGFVDRVEAIKSQLQQDPESVGFETLLATAQEWFLEHILEEDLKIKAHVSSVEG